ncbi:MAG: acetate--CoA ligase family protein [Chloroflexi bacterium]|nr:acetate--CoA ligase family protein [Chloroflexota bacterium]
MIKSSIIGKVREERRTSLTEVEGKELLQEWGIITNITRLARSEEEALSLAHEIGLPVALKIVSPSIIHKSDSGGVMLGLSSAEEVIQGFREILRGVKAKEPEANIIGVSVQSMARPGIEVIVGMFKDAQFGPVIMFGLGGIFVEILKDVSLRIVPITRRDAQEMISEIKAYPILQGYRGQEAAHIPTLEDILLKVSAMAEANPEIKELDINPIFAYSDGAVAVDARVILEPGP